MQGKRLGLAVASEETYPGAALGIVHQIQEFARYTHSDFVGFVHGAGNSRGEIAADPRQPLLAAQALGAEFFTRKYSDYRIETPRSHSVWESPAAAHCPRVSQPSAIGQSVSRKRSWKKAKWPIDARPIEAGESRRWVRALPV